MPIQIILKSVIAIGLIVLIFFPLFQKHNRVTNRIFQSCIFVSKRIIPLPMSMEDWLLHCRTQSHKAMRETSELKQLLASGNRILSELKVSHLELFNEEENQAIWNDTDLENGLESKFIDGQLIVTEVWPNSEAKKKKIQMGDRVVLGANESLSPYELNRWKGKLTFERSNKNFTVEFEPKILVRNLEMALFDMQGVKVISVGSFKSQYFSADKLDAVFSKIRRTDKIVIDLRGNSGGNFVSGLRFLSAFLCHPTTVGYMKKNKALGSIGYFENQLDDEYQIDVLRRFDSVALQTFKYKYCMPPPSIVIIDAQTKSTAEWVALALRDRLKTPIHGSTSAGELLVGIWYDVSNIWGDVVKLSIPEAYYESINGIQIEGHGVSADKTLYPLRADFQNGFDSELWQVIQTL